MILVEVRYNDEIKDHFCMKCFQRFLAQLLETPTTVEIGAVGGVVCSSCRTEWLYELTVKSE